MSQQIKEARPNDAPEFFKKYASDSFLKKFEKKYSIEDATRMILNVEDILQSGNEKSFDQAKKALSWDSTLQHQYFVEAKSDQQRLDIFTENSWYSKMQKPVNWAIDKLAERKSDVLLTASMALLIKAALIVAVGTTLPIAAGFALAIALPAAYEFVEKGTNRTKWIEPLAKVLEEAGVPLAIKDIAKHPRRMPLRDHEQKEMDALLASENYSTMSNFAKSKAELTIRKRILKNLTKTISELPASVKVAIHRNNIDELIEFTDKFEARFKEALSAQADRIKSTKPSQRGIVKARLARDVARNIGRDIAFQVNYDKSTFSGIVKARIVTSSPVTFVEDSIIRTGDSIKDGYANVKEKLGSWRNSVGVNSKPNGPKRPRTAA